ncbi:sec-independent protein translocase protein TatC (plasmid) [Rhizorhabdus wittichii RW1]|jgi:hemoglobin|uniref:Sec-independent protein translocase protein TatC n=1 Tax=Rhizorhabdus wittichii (strain DSM 6014 / CCUG 31198 / JCM 15750 / NBRC 105917 / EY 4224 / RW1) TaxID=392499 RepID=A0A9J9LGR2_RHIWR|nr:sec-independent protein translocase protein TatC [Rhizorhabdus wittichii RW1]
MSACSIDETAIDLLVPAFYARVRADALLGPIFESAIDDWPHHLAKLKDFWSSVMLASGRYKGQPMPAHIRHETALSKEAFARWLAIWRETTDELLAPAVARAFQDKAARIAESLQLGMQFHRERSAA